MTNDGTGYGPHTPPPAAGDPRPAYNDPNNNGFFPAIRRLGITRSQDRWVGGVAGGLAQRTGLDPLLVRGLVAVTMLLGVGLVLYGLAWALLPEPDGRIHLEQAIHGNFDGALVGAGALVLVGFTSGNWFDWIPFGRSWFSGLLWALAVVAIIVVAASALRDRRKDGPPMPPPPSHPEGQVPMTEPSQPGSAPAAGPAHPKSTAPVRPTYPAPGTPAGPPATGAPYPPQQPYRMPPTPPPPYGRPAMAQVPPVPPKPPAPPKPPKVVKPQVPGPGPAITGVVVGLILIGLATLLILNRIDVYNGPIASVVTGSAIVLVGLAIILSGLRGRRAGGLTALAIVGFIIAGPAITADDYSVWDSSRNVLVSTDDSAFHVTSRGTAEKGFTVGIGSSTIDLTDIPLNSNTLTIPVRAGLGDVTVIVPADIPVSATVRSGGGDVTWLVDDQNQSASGVGHVRTFTSDEMSDGTQAQISLEINLGLGSITIEEN